MAATVTSLPSATAGGFYPYLPGGGSVLGPIVVNAYTTLGIPPYWRAMNFVANNMATFPRFVARGGTEVTHALTPLLKRRPNRYQGPAMFWRTLFFHRAHAGNGYAEIERDRLYRPVALHVRPPESVVAFWVDPGDGSGPAAYYYCGPTRLAEAHIVAAADMIHLSGLSYDGVAGMNPVTVLAEALERARSVDKFMTRYLQRGTVIKAAVQLPAGLDEEQQARVVATIRNHFAGPNADRDIIVLSEGATLNNAGVSAVDAQLIQQAAYTTKQVAQITGVPPVFLYDLTESKYRASTEQDYQAVVRDLFRPLIEQDEDEFSAKLLTDADVAAGLGIELDPSALLRGDTTTTSAVTLAQVAAGVITANEGRAALGYAKSTDPDADKLKRNGDTTGARPAGGGTGPEKISGDTSEGA